MLHIDDGYIEWRRDGPDYYGRVEGISRYVIEPHGDMLFSLCRVMWPMPAPLAWGRVSFLQRIAEIDTIMGGSFCSE